MRKYDAIHGLIDWLVDYPIKPPLNSINSFFLIENVLYVSPGNTKGGSISVQLTSCLTGLESAV